MGAREGRKPVGYNWLVANALGYEGEDCLLWPYSSAQCGYGMLNVNRRAWYAHRWVCEQTKGPAPDESYHAAHSCGNKKCVSPKHLDWKTNGENQLDRLIHEPGKRPRRKLTPEGVAEIRRLQGVESRLSLAARFKVNEATVRQVQYGKIWKTGQPTYKGKLIRNPSMPPQELQK